MAVAKSLKSHRNKMKERLENNIIIQKEQKGGYKCNTPYSQTGVSKSINKESASKGLKNFKRETNLTMIQYVIEHGTDFHCFIIYVATRLLYRDGLIISIWGNH